ncbi:hypothetical protein [Colwellia hornerae]|uniref:Uncharacterized protein n=1 Tax=Colwellia hornerae TaxID=89402 RepID=A0A5C6Q8A4_9GAMM|nr:hypothetical protein [Colwellia hornerae]TWX57790.1 hypothetical protein ESZ28_03525 [Colwellia hornerae]TWX62479.1 hypothetical protein ESZ26_01160 [Colwellia hornerae]TWX65038.1 hypothetical protein ESZ27_13025 [Colwellia hornerae]
MNNQRDFSNRLTFDFEKISSSDYAKITKSVVAEFKLSPHTELIKGLDEAFQDFTFNQSIIGLEWDIWSGYTVNAKNSEANSLVEKIATYIRVNNT